MAGAGESESACTRKGARACMSVDALAGTALPGTLQPTYLAALRQVTKMDHRTQAIKNRIKM